MKAQKIILFSLIVSIVWLSFSCNPALGSSWYSRSVGNGTSGKKTLIVQSITISKVTLYPEANGEDFIGTVNIPELELSPDDIHAEVVDNKGQPASVTVTIKGAGGQAVLKEGEIVTVPIRIRDMGDPDIEIQKYLFLKQDSSMNNGGESANYNPKDPKGNSKFVIKIKTATREENPWSYYREGEPDASDTGNFNSNKFDQWVLNMPSMSGIIASYKFREGVWNGGSPEICDNIPSGIGEGIKGIWDVKVYRYKSRAERWSGSYTPTPDPNDERFHFFKFTAQSNGGTVDSSMFCVDRYSKFLFYYSEPAVIKNVLNNWVPSNWTDYAAPTQGKHTNFPEPFYKTDPVGFVKEDGSVVLYEWIIKNINAANYGAKQNPNYTQPAGRKSKKAGFSPYKENLKITTKEINKEKNPKYTAVKPVILEQPKDGYAKLNSAENIVFEVKTAPVPDGETLSYQWYKADSQTGAGTEITGATESLYKIDTSAETECYFYCIVKNTNTDNHKSEQTESERAKCHITGGEIRVDALSPKITMQPEKSYTLRIKSQAAPITLRVKAVSQDGGTLSYQWYKADSPTGEGVAETVDEAKTDSYTFTPDTSAAGITYYYCAVTNTNNAVSGEQAAVKKSRYTPVEVEQSYKIEFSVAGEDGGTLTALHNGKAIQSGTYVKKGETIQFIATPQTKLRYKVKEWAGITLDPANPNTTFAQLTVADKDESISVAFEQKMRLTVTPKLKNETLQSWSTADSDHFSHKYVGGVHLSHKCAVRVNGGGNVTKSWDYMFPIKEDGGKWIQVQSEYFFEVGTDKSAGSNWLKAEFSSFDSLKITLTDYLLKANRHDYWNAEWTTWGGGRVYPLQAIDNNSVFPLIYDEAAGQWAVDKSNVDIKHSDDIPLPAEFAGTKPNPNRKISYKGVTISYDENFTLRDGEEKDFVITYKVDNHDETRSKGEIKVIYTISWK